MATLQKKTTKELLKGIRERIEAEQLSSTKKVTQVLYETGIDYNNVLQEIAIDTLSKPFYSTRVQIDNRIKALKQSLIDFGFLGGIFVHKENGHIIDGFYRVELWKELGNTTIPCFLIECNLAQEKELHLRLNTQSSAFKLADFGLNFSGINLIEDFGFTEEDLKPITVIQPKPKEKKQNTTPEGFTKFSTLISNESYKKLSEYKNRIGLQNMSDVIETLIELI